MGPEQGNNKERTHTRTNAHTHTTRESRTPGAFPACTASTCTAPALTPNLLELIQYNVPDLVELAELLHAPGAPPVVDLSALLSSVGTSSGKLILDLSFLWDTQNQRLPL